MNQEEISREGALTPAALVRVLGAIICRHQTCMLFFQRSEDYRAVYFEEGALVYAESNRKDETLSYRLLDSGLIDLDTLGHAIKQVQPNRNLARVLVESGVLEKDHIDDLMRSLIADIVIQIFDWESGSYMIQEVASLYGKDLYYGLSTVGIMLEGVRRMYNFEEIMDPLLKSDSPLRFSDDPHVGKQKLNLEPAEGFILSRVDGHSTARDICSVSMLSEEMTCRVIFGLICGGLLVVDEPEKKTIVPGSFRVEKVSAEELQSKASRYVPPPAPPAPLEAPAPSKTEPISPPIAQPSTSKFPVYGGTSLREAAQTVQAPAAAAPPPPKTHSGYSAHQQEFVSQLESVYDIIDQANYFSILGVPRDAPNPLIHDAYHKLADRYHPKHNAWLTDPLLQSKLAYVFAKMTKAHSVLISDKERIEYDEQVRRDEKTHMSAELRMRREFFKTDRQLELAAEELQAEEHYKKAKDHANQKRYHDAMVECRNALKLCPNTARFHHLLGKVLGKNPKMKWQKDAESHLVRAMELNQWQPEYPFQLAILYKNAGLGIKAQKCFIQTLELEPNHEGALAEVPPELRPKPKIKEFVNEEKSDMDDGTIE